MKFIITSREIQTHTPLELMRLALNRFFFAAKKDYEVKQFKESPTYGGGEIFEIEIVKQEKNHERSARRHTMGRLGSQLSSELDLSQ